MIPRFPSCQIKSSKAVFTPSFTEVIKGLILAEITEENFGRVVIFLELTKTIAPKIIPVYSAQVVARAAPLIPIAGKPK